MTKKRSRNLFIVFAIILVICLVACFVNFTLPFPINGNYYSYTSFISSLKMGEDISSSLRIVYSASVRDDTKASDFSSLKKSTMETIKGLIQGEGYKDVTVAEMGEDEIVVTIGNISSKEDSDAISSLVDEMYLLTFSTNSDGRNPFAYGNKHVKSIEAKETSGQYYIVVEFKDEYKSLANEMTSGQTLYMFLGDKQFAELDYSSSSMTDGIIYLQSSSFNSLEDAKSTANYIKTGLMDVNLERIQIKTITPSYGVGANVLLWIALAILVLITFVFLIIRYKEIGWLTCFNLLFFIVLSMFLLQSIPTIHVNLSGIIAIAVGFVLAVESIMKILETAKEHYRKETPFYVSMNISQKENLSKILILNAVMLVVGFVSMFMPNASVQSFGWILFIISIVATFTTLALMRLFIKMYLSFNNSNGEKCNFHKGGRND